MKKNLLDSRQVAAALNISRSLVYYLIRMGELPAVRIGKMIRVRARDVEAFIGSRERTLIAPAVRSHRFRPGRLPFSRQR